VAAIAATGAIVSAERAKAATATIPIVFYYGADPVRNGLVASLNRPGGNLTGVATLGQELGPKRLELLHELLPAVRDIAMLVHPANPAAETLKAAARTLGLQIHFLPALTERDFDAAFANLSSLRAGGLWIGPFALFVSRSEQLAALALRNACPRFRISGAIARRASLVTT
jgi:putative ABC transport system substrate-binding protein